MTYPQRRQKIVRLLSELDLDVLIFFQPENLRYLCGFSGSDGILLVTADQLVFMTDSRYTTQANKEVSADRIIEYKTQDAYMLSLPAHIAFIGCIRQMFWRLDSNDGKE